MKFRRVFLENIPCWYELAWQKKTPAIILRVHKDFIKTVPVLSEKNPLIGKLMKDFQFSSFSGGFDRNFGFNNTLFEGTFEYTGEKDEFTEFLIRIPKVKVKTHENCRYCGGSGYEEESDRECLHCDGTGIKYDYKWQPANAVSASFTIFFWLANHPDKEDTSAPFPQLMTVETITREGMHGGSLSGEISIPLRKWLISLGDGVNIPEMLQAMKKAYAQMLGVHNFDEFHFRVDVRENGGFIADCPGDACGVHPSSWYMQKEEGYEFSCHNVDNPVQQITLLSGLAALHDKARREIKT